MRINDLLKKYGRFTLDDDYENTINDKIITDSEIITNTSTEFKLHYTEDDGSTFELTIQAPHTIISTWHTPDGEVYMYHKEVNGMLSMS